MSIKRIVSAFAVIVVFGSLAEVGAAELIRHRVPAPVVRVVVVKVQVPMLKVTIHPQEVTT